MVHTPLGTLELWWNEPGSSKNSLELGLTLREKLGKGESSHDVKLFIETLRVTNPVRQSRASSREASLAWGRATVTAKRRQQDQTLCD